MYSTSSTSLSSFEVLQKGYRIRKGQCVWQIHVHYSMSFSIAFSIKCQIVFRNILRLCGIWDLHAISHLSLRIEMTTALSSTHPSDSLASMSTKVDDGWLMDNLLN